MWKNLVLIPLSLLVSFVIIESVARIWLDVASPYPMEPGMHVMETRRFWVLQPGLQAVMDNGTDFAGKNLTIGEDGSRVVPCQPKAGQNGRRLVLVGDSQTFGAGLADDEAWPSILSCRLRDKGISVQVYNYGVPGINIDQYHKRVVEQVAGMVEPNDLVVVSVTWNDLHTASDLRPDVSSVKDEGKNDRKMAPRSEPLIRLADPLIYAYPATWRYNLFRKTGIFIPAFSSIGEFIESFGHVSVVWRELMQRARLLYYRIRPATDLQEKIGAETFAQNFEILADINRRILMRGAKLIVHLLPNRVFTDEFYYDSYSANGLNFPAQDYMTFIAKPFCDRLGLTCMTSFDVLKTNNRDEYTFPVDGHLNASGAKRVADNLRSYLLTTSCAEVVSPCRL